MGCRGGELDGDQIDILTTNDAICGHIKTHWFHYKKWADRALKFGIENEGDKLQTKDLIKILENVVTGFAPKTGLNYAVRMAKPLTKKDFVSIVARAIYESPQQCPENITMLLKKCRGE